MSTHPVAAQAAAETPVEVDSERESIAGLFRRLIDEITTLIRVEIRLARSEIGASVADAGTGVGAVALGGVLGLVAVACLLVALIVWLGDKIGLAASALCVGVVLAIGAAALVFIGLGKLQHLSLAPKRAAANLKRDAQLLKGD